MNSILNDKKWKRVNHGMITIPLIDYLENLIIEQYDLGNKVKICIGTDSQKRGKKFKFSTVIIFEMKQPMGLEYGKMVYKGLGAKVITGDSIDTNPMKIQERMLKEVQMSIDVGYHILDLIELYEVDLEIHADVNPNPRWASNIALTQAVGFITGMGFVYKVKPDAYAASCGADKQCNS